MPYLCDFCEFDYNGEHIDWSPRHKIHQRNQEQEDIGSSPPLRLSDILGWSDIVGRLSELVVDLDVDNHEDDEGKDELDKDAGNGIYFTNCGCWPWLKQNLNVIIICDFNYQSFTPLVHW